MEHLLDFFIPKHYQLSLFLDKHQKSLQGTVKISGKITKAGLLKLHSVNQTIDSLKINDVLTDFTLENGVLTALTTPESLVEVEVGFHGSLNENMQGAYLSSYDYNGKPEYLISTQFESHYAREAFPCVDEPAAKATFELSITIPDDDDIVLSNTAGAKSPIVAHHGGYDRVIGAEPRNDGREDAGDASGASCKAVVWKFEKTPKMSTYLLAFVVGRFNVLETHTKSGTLVRTFAPLDQRHSLLSFPNQTAKASLEYYEDLFNTPYPLEKLDQVAIPDFEAGAMENWGLVTYRSSQLLCDDSSSLDVKKSVALTITHELSHQWFGNLVTMHWWNDLWLNESFATIMEYFCSDALFPDFKVWDDFFTTDCFAALSRDALPGVQAVREDVSDPAEIATLFDPCIVYAKGAHLMLMLLREMQQDQFFKGLKDYFKKYAYKNTTANDLWKSLNPYADFDVKEFMTAWLTQPGYPVLTDGTQQRFLLDGSTDASFYPIPEVKDDMSGHYLVNLSGPEFAEAVENFDHLAHEQQLRLLIDRLLLSETPLVSSASLLPLLPQFKHETSAPVWTLVDFIISRLTLFLDDDSPEELKFKAYIYDLVKSPLARLGLTPKPAESSNDTDLRNIFLVDALYSKDPAFLASATALYTSDFASIPAEARRTVLSARLWLAEAETYPELLAGYRAATNPELKSDLLSVLAKPRLEKNLDFAFSLLKNPDLLKPQDHLSFLLRLRRWRFSRDRALAWTFDNWKYIYKINGEKSVEDYPRYLASTIDKPEDAQSFFDFFTPLASDPVLARTLKVAKTNIESTLSLIASDKSAVLRAIQKL
ncbi:M1 family metallopeptidase [Candidatus Saccharibacteria bacterium]|nr:M1 family metallopeptidase [Candidatus Saccharibacteria bacterium]